MDTRAVASTIITSACANIKLQRGGGGVGGGKVAEGLGNVAVRKCKNVKDCLTGNVLRTLFVAASGCLVSRNTSQ